MPHGENFSFVAELGPDRKPELAEKIPDPVQTVEGPAPQVIILSANVKEEAREYFRKYSEKLRPTVGDNWMDTEEFIERVEAIVMIVRGPLK